MKNFYASLLFLFASWTTFAQNVNFTDAAFKDYLVTKMAIDTDNDNYPDASVDTNLDGEIQLTEAIAVTNLCLLYSNASLSIIDMTGIEAFSNLTKIKSNFTVNYSFLNALSHLETIDISGSHSFTVAISGLQHLKTIECSNSSIGSLSLSALPNLETLLCGGNAVMSINVSELTNLKTLNCSGMRLTSLDVSNLTNLIDLRCGSNNITSIDLSQNVNLENLDCSYWKGTTLNLPPLPHLKTLTITGSSLVSVDLSQLIALERFDSWFSHSLNVLTLGNKPFLKSLICSDGDIEILDLSNAPNLEELFCSDNRITALDVSNKPNLQYVVCDDNQIAALHFSAGTNLTYLVCSNNVITDLNLDGLTAVTDLNCSNNLIATLNVTNLIHLNSLDCSNNTISALNTTPLNSLYLLDCSNNQISSLDLSNTVNLSGLECSTNLLTSLSIAHLSNLRRLNCSNNQLTTLDLPTVTYFSTNSHGSTARTRYDCRNNLFTTLDFSTISSNVSTIQLGGNPNLTYVNLKNSRTYYEVFSLDNCPNLHYICINAYQDNPVFPYGGVFQYLSDQTLLDNIQINSYCSFTPGGIYNTITGTFSMDLDNNGCDANDFHFPDSKITIDNAPAIFRATYTDTNGVFNFYTQAGNYIIKPEFEHPYFTVSPASATINFTESNSSVQTQNFCVIPNGIHKDLEITLIPLRTPRPGFDATYKLVYKNKGNQMLSGNINFTFDDTVLDFIEATPALTNQSSNTLHWSYTQLKPFESRSISFTLNVNSPMEIPAVNAGDILNFNATIDPVTGDETIADNTSNLTQTVRGSYDPNDKICLEGSVLSPEQVGGYLHYLIRFQNSGTAAAEKVVIKDIIDTDKFDITSLELTSTSHPQITKITGNKVEFQFDNINLPPAIENEPASHGYVVFKIKTKSGLTIGDSVSNKADIYFDYNFPITTEPATSTVALLGLGQFENASVSIAPNPVSEVLRINAKEKISSVQLIDIQGRILETRLFSNNQVDFDFSQKANGVYFVKITTDKGQKTEKVIKK